MVCIDELLFASAGHAQARVRLSPDHILLHNGILTEAGYVELAAQTAGAMKGYLEKKLGLSAREGFLAAAQNFVFHGKARQGDLLRIAVAATAEVAGVSLLDASILREENNGDSPLLAGGRLKLFVPEAGSDATVKM
jgi:predicted hotdog family 3-hydroxylacyl-ACP dehydratase